MNIVDFFVRIYRLLYSDKYIINRLKALPRFLIRRMANLILPRCLSRTKTLQQVQSDVIVSLTSFPTRINYVWMVVECMLRQTYKPKKILLWLSKEQFNTLDEVPISLRSRINDCFNIKLVDGDIRSHKKYYYVMQLFPESYVFLVDDDIFYPSDIIERSIRERESQDANIICNYALHIAHGDKKLSPYNTWKRECGYSKCDSLFFGSGGGTLLRPCDLYPDVLNIRLAQELTPIADDIWLNAMARINGLKIHVLKNGLILPIMINGDSHLSSKNRGLNLNDLQFARINEYYSNKGIKIF